MNNTNFTLIINNYSALSHTDKVNFIYSLAGPAKKKFRQEFMQFLTGKKLPLTKCGIHTLEQQINIYINNQNLEKMKRSHLIKAAEELNTLLELEPAIDTDADDAEFIAKMKEAAKLVEPEDTFTKNTEKVIKGIAKMTPTKIEEDLEPEETQEEEPVNEVAEEVVPLDDLKEKIEKCKGLGPLKALCKDHPETFGSIPVAKYNAKEAIPMLKSAMLNAMTGEEVVEEEVKETPEKPATKKEKKPTEKKAGKVPEAKKEDPSKSNKGQVYLAWKNGETNLDTLLNLVENRVKKATIKNWISMWGRNQGLPAIAKQK